MAGKRIFASTPDLVTVTGVELCTTGIEYPLASGAHTFTEKDLADAVASQEDPAIVAPRVWLGHPEDDRFHKGRAALAGSAEPAVGTVQNMRLTADRQTVIGDLVDVPVWLANILHSAYPSRSVEGATMAETTTGHKWNLVITGLALLGVRWPGVSTLPDLEKFFYSEDVPEGVELEDAVAATMEANGMGNRILNAVRRKPTVEAGANVEDVRRAYYDSLGPLQDFWWVRSVILDDNGEDVLIVDNGDGEIYRVVFTIKGDEPEFEDPQEVKVEYAPVAASIGTASGFNGLAVLTSTGRLAASFTSRADSRPESTTEEGSPSMKPEQIRTLRSRAGLSEEQLPDNATEEQIDAALASLPEATPAAVPAAVAPEGGDGGASDGTPEITPASTEAQPTPVAAAAAAAPGTVTVPAEVWEQVQANAAAGAEVAQATEVTRRSGIVSAAVNEGRIAPAQSEHYARMFESDPEGTERLLTAAVTEGGLMPGTIPVTERGGDVQATASQDLGYDPAWLPELAAQGAASGPVTSEDV